MKPPAELDAGLALAPVDLPTRLCSVGWDDHDYRGFKVFRDLAGRETTTGMIGLAATGRRLTSDVVTFLDDVASVAGPPDPRIWAPKATRVASAYGRCLPALAVGVLVVESDDVGPMTCGASARFFRALSEAVGDDLAPATIERETLRLAKAFGRVAGFGVHFRAEDERLVALRRLVAERGFSGGRYFRLFEEVAATFRRTKKIEPNFGSLITAVLLDLGVHPDHIGLLVFFVVLPAQFANAVEGAEQAPAVLRRLPDERIDYVGPAPRTSPRALAAARS